MDKNVVLNIRLQRQQADSPLLAPRKAMVKFAYNGEGPEAALERFAWLVAELFVSTAGSIIVNGLIPFKHAAIFSIGI